MMGRRKCSDPEIRAVLNHRESQNGDELHYLLLSLLNFCLWDGVLYKNNSISMAETWLLVVPDILREEIIHDSGDEPIAGHLA